MKVGLYMATANKLWGIWVRPGNLYLKTGNLLKKDLQPI